MPTINTFGSARGYGLAGAAAPNQVTGLTATDFGTSRAYNDGRIDLSWSTPANNGATITGYKIERSTDNVTYSVLVANTGSATTTYSNTGLSSNQIYYYKVSAINAAGTGLASSAANATSTTVPQAPTVSAANVGTGRAYNNGAATVTVSGGATGGKAITSYTATSSPGSFTATSGSPLTVTGLQSATAYTFSVTATNANGTSTATVSNSITATTVPQAPTIGTATAGNASATVTYTANATGGSAITTFTATSSPGSITGTGASPITVSGLTNNTAYTFTVTATNANGTSAASAASNSVTPIGPYWIELATNQGSGSLNIGTDGTYIYSSSSSGGDQKASKYDYTGAAIAGRNTTWSGTAKLYVNRGGTYWDNGGNQLYVCGEYYPNNTQGFGHQGFMSFSNSLNVNTAYYNNANNSSKTVTCTAAGGYGNYQLLGGSRFYSTDNFTYSYFSLWAAGSFTAGKHWSSQQASVNAVAFDRGPTYGYIAAQDWNGGGYDPNVLQVNTSGNVTWTRKISFQTSWSSFCDITAGSGSGNVIAMGQASNGTMGFVALNSSGTLQWQRQISGLYNDSSTFGRQNARIITDTSNNIYAMIPKLNASPLGFYLIKYNSSGVLQWQRQINGDIGNPYSIATDGTNIFVMSDRTPSSMFMRYPADGSVTGTYTFNGSSLTIVASSLTESAASMTVTTVTPSFTSFGSGTTAESQTSVSSTPTVSGKVSL